MNRMNIIRHYTEQFEGDKRDRISALIDGYGAALSTSEYKYQVHELQRCLHAGLLLSALHNAASLLELFVRDLVARHELKQSGSTANWQRELVQRELALEQDRNMGFDKLIGRAHDFGLVSEQDKSEMVRFYKDTRIPLAHGIIRRFVANKNYRDYSSEDAWLKELFAPLDRFHGLETAIEDNSLKELTSVLDFIHKHRFAVPSVNDNEAPSSAPL